MYLYIDTSHKSTIGLLSESYEWIEWITIERKASFLQSEIAGLLKKCNQDFSDIKKVYYSAGPGSYTGMRITEGFVGTLEILKMETYGFYLFDLLETLDIKEACWISSAFKGEYFFAKDQTTFLLDATQAESFVQENRGEMYSFEGLDFFNLPTKSVQDLLIQNPKVFKKITGKKKPYYYRPLDKEFTVKKS